MSAKSRISSTLVIPFSVNLLSSHAISLLPSAFPFQHKIWFSFELILIVHWFQQVFPWPPATWKCYCNDWCQSRFDGCRFLLPCCTSAGTFPLPPPIIGVLCCCLFPSKKVGSGCAFIYLFLHIFQPTWNTPVSSINSTHYKNNQQLLFNLLFQIL